MSLFTTAAVPVSTSNKFGCMSPAGLIEVITLSPEEIMSKTSERTVAIMVRITPSGDKVINDNKGLWSKSEYVRQALILANRQSLKGPTEREI